MRIVIGASTFAIKDDSSLNLMLRKGIEVVKNPHGRKLTEAEIIEHLKDADGLLAGLEPLNERVLNNAQQLKAISRIGIGMENIDLEATQKRNIKVSNTPDSVTEAVAEMTLAALLTIARQIIPANENLHKGIWEKTLGFSLGGITVAVIGYGRIGMRVAELLKAFKVNVIVYDVNKPEISATTLEDAIKHADVISLHASGNKEILTSEMFNSIKKEVVILNSARGGLVNEDGLYDCLNAGIVSYYWGDVFPDEPYNGKLIECKNAILTPHISTYSAQCRKAMEMEAVGNIMRDLSIV